MFEEGSAAHWQGATVLKDLGIDDIGGISAGKGTNYLIIDRKKQQVPSDYCSIYTLKSKEENQGENRASQVFESPASIDFSQLETV